MPPSTQAPDQHQCPRWPPERHQLPLPTPAWPSLARLRLASPRLASPHLTGAAPPTPASAHLPPTTPLRTRGVRLLHSGSRSSTCLLSQPNVRSALFLPVRPPSFGEEDGRGRGKGWEVGERARRQSVVVSWLRAAVAE